MARQVRKPTAAERNRRTQERLRQNEIADRAGGGDSLVWQSLEYGYSDVTSGTISNYQEPKYAVQGDLVHLTGVVFYNTSYISHGTPSLLIPGIAIAGHEERFPCAFWHGTVIDPGYLSLINWAGAPFTDSGVGIEPIPPGGSAYWGAVSHYVTLNGSFRVSA